MKKIWSLTKSDLFSIWKTNKILLLITLVYEGVYCVVGGDMSFLAVIAVVLGGMLSYNSIAYDERSGWNRFVLTTAYSRKDYVLGKYLLAAVGISAGSAALFLADNLALNLKRISADQMLSPALPAVMAATLVMVGITLPLSLRFGIEKARLISLLTIVLICGTAGAMSVLNEGAVFTGSTVALNFLILAVGIVLFILSAVLSVQIYSRRQL